MDVTVVVPTYGDPDWQTLAQRAVASAEAEGVPVVQVDGADLADARNYGLSLVETDFVCFLDADDELEAGYFDAMSVSDADLRAPSVRYVLNRRRPAPYVPRVSGHRHDCGPDCLAFGNYLVIGTVARTSLVRHVGGFRDFAVYEDWDLWVRCWRAGASIETVPEAIYRAHVRPDSRNRAPERDVKLTTHQAIAQANGLPVPA